MTKKKNQKENFVEFIKQMSEAHRIDESIIIESLKEAFTTAYSKKLEAELAPSSIKRRKVILKGKETTKLPNALVRCEIDLDKKNIELYHQKIVTKEDDITDDFIEISDEDPEVVNRNLKVGDYFETPIDLEKWNKSDVIRFATYFNQKISSIEKENIYDIFKEKLHKLVTGVVESADSNRVLVNLIGNSRDGATTTLYRKDLIGEEKFNPGDNIKVYIESIGNDQKYDKKDGIIKASRSCNGFLEELFKNEVHEIYDGTVEIVDIARRAGIRSKVAVRSVDKNVDPSGACIGPNGSRIQSIVSNLGNGGSKEKIDIINYNENRGLYLAECLKPGTVIGIIFNDTNKSATVICENGTNSFAIGERGTNVILAKRLLKLEKIDIIDETTAEEQGLVYKTMDVFELEAKEEERKRNYEAAYKRSLELKQEKEKENNEETVIKEETTIKKNEEPVKVKEEKEVKEEVVETKEDPVETREVNTTISLDALEASLESEKKTNTQQNSKKKKKEVKQNIDTKTDKDEVKKPVEKMDIYTEEELKALEEEEEFEDYDDEDFSEYDDDSYYEDN